MKAATTKEKQSGNCRTRGDVRVCAAAAGLPGPCATAEQLHAQSRNVRDYTEKAFFLKKSVEAQNASMLQNNVMSPVDLYLNRTPTRRWHPLSLSVSRPELGDTAAAPCIHHDEVMHETQWVALVLVRRLSASRLHNRGLTEHVVCVAQRKAFTPQFCPEREK